MRPQTPVEGTPIGEFPGIISISIVHYNIYIIIILNKVSAIIKYLVYIGKILKYFLIVFILYIVRF